MPVKCLAQSSQQQKQSLSSSNLFDFKGEEIEACEKGGISPSSHLLGEKILPLPVPLAFPDLLVLATKACALELDYVELRWRRLPGS